MLYVTDQAEEHDLNWILGVLTYDIETIKNGINPSELLLVPFYWKTEVENILVSVKDSKQAALVIEYIIDQNGKMESFWEIESDGWTSLYNGFLFSIGLLVDKKTIKIIRNTNQLSFTVGGETPKYGIHSLDKVVRSKVTGLNRLILNQGELSYDGRLTMTDSENGMITGYFPNQGLKDGVDLFETLILMNDNKLDQEFIKLNKENQIKYLKNKSSISFSNDNFSISLAKGNNKWHLNIIAYKNWSEM